MTEEKKEVDSPHKMANLLAKPPASEVVSRRDVQGIPTGREEFNDDSKDAESALLDSPDVESEYSLALKKLRDEAIHERLTEKQRAIITQICDQADLLKQNSNDADIAGLVITLVKTHELLTGIELPTDYNSYLRTNENTDSRDMKKLVKTIVALGAETEYVKQLTLLNDHLKTNPIKYPRYQLDAIHEVIRQAEKIHKSANASDTRDLAKALNMTHGRLTGSVNSEAFNKHILEEVYGKPSPGWKKFGIAMMAFGVTVATAGLVVAEKLSSAGPHGIPFGLGIGFGIAILGGAIWLIGAVISFIAGSKTGLSAKMDKLEETLPRKLAAPAAAPSIRAQPPAIADSPAAAGSASSAPPPEAPEHSVEAHAAVADSSAVAGSATSLAPSSPNAPTEYRRMAILVEDDEEDGNAPPTAGLPSL